MPYELPPLPYPTNALEPHIDARTMEIHHGKHHAAYVTNLNNAIGASDIGNQPIESLVAKIDSVPENIRTVVRNNGGGHANHSLFWETLGPNGGGEPTGALGEAVQATFGAFDVLKQQMVDAGVKRFGSGWSWLVWDGTGLAVMSTPNQDSPVMEGKTPLFGIDVWEHAYYLKYQNRRPEYLEAIWNVVNWDAVAARFDAAGH